MADLSQLRDREHAIGRDDGPHAGNLHVMIAGRTVLDLGVGALAATCTAE